VIIGGGFGGLAAAHKLAKAHIDVTLVERHNHHLFQPLLYQVALGSLSGSECATPIRGALSHAPQVRVLMADVTDIDAEQRQVLLDRGDRLDYDSLIVACGAQTSYFGRDEWADVTCGLKSLEEGNDLRQRFYGALEQAERTDDPDERAEWLSFVVVGAGPTGVEIAGAMVLTAARLRANFTQFDPARIRVTLLDAGERPVAAFSKKLSAKVVKQLGSLGVMFRAGARATGIDPHGVTFEVDGTEERIASRTVVWAAGVQAVPLAAAVAKATGAETDRGGRIHVQPDLTVPGHPEISVIGDVACVKAGKDGAPLPGLATVAIQEAHHVTEAIAAGQPGASTPFHYFDKGALAVVGRGRAVCEIRGLELWGLPAFATYFLVHLYYLGGQLGHRAEVLNRWAGSFFGQRRSALIVGDIQSIDRTEQPTQSAQ